MIVLTDTRRGGAPNRCASIARGLRPFGWEPLVVSLLPGGAVLEDLRAEGIAVASLDISSWSGLPAAAARFRHLLRSWRPAVVQTSLWHANVLGRVVAGGARGRSPLVDTFDGVDPGKPAARVAVDRTTHRRAAAHVAVSEAAARTAVQRERVPSRTIRVIPLGIDHAYWAARADRAKSRAELGLPPGATVVAWAGRLDPVKDVPTLLRAVAARPGWWLVLAGDGRLREAVGRQILVAGLDGRVRRLGEVDDVRPVYGAADVFALPSRSEGMPVALLEAMAAGLPVVATRVGGIPEVVTPGHDGLLVDPGDPGALAAGLEEAAARPDLGERATETVAARFSEHRMLQAYDGLWREVLG